MPDEELPRGLYKAPFKIERPEKVSQTLLAHLDRCPYSGALYVRHKGGPPTPEMARGTAFHDFVERATNYLIEEGENAMPPEVAKDMMQVVLEERIDLAISVHEHDACRLMAWNWGAATVLEPDSIIGVEQTLELPVGDYIVRGRLDLLTGAHNDAVVEDYKTSKRVQPQERYENSVQPQVYGLLALEGIIEGETAPLGKGLDGVHCKEVYPRFRYQDGEGFVEDFSGEQGEMVHRHVYYDRGQLHDFRRTLESHLAKLEHGIETQVWAAQDSTYNCALCPASSECPIPERVKSVKTIGTLGDAQEIAQRIEFRKRDNELDTDALKEWVDLNVDVETADGVWSFKAGVSERKDKDAIEAFLRDHGIDPAPYLTDAKGLKALLKGHLTENGADPEDYFKRIPMTRFGKYDHEEDTDGTSE